MPRVNNVIQQVSQLNTYEQEKVFDFLKTVLMSNGITNSIDEEIAEIDLTRGSAVLFAIMIKYLSMENIMVRMALNKGINAKIQSAKKLSMIFLNPQFQVVKRD